jgi:rhodanese-related sulfurtransferase
MELSVQSLAEQMNRGELVVLLDVREPFERDLCAIQAPLGATDLHIPMRSVASRLPEIHLAAAQAVLVVYCHHGVRSRAVGEWLLGQGITGVQNLSGGIDAWSRLVDPSVPRY